MFFGILNKIKKEVLGRYGLYSVITDIRWRYRCVESILSGKKDDDGTKEPLSPGCLPPHSLGVTPPFPSYSEGLLETTKNDQ